MNRTVPPLLPSRKASPPVGWYSLCLPTKGWPGWVDLGGWSHSETNVLHREFYPDTVIQLSTNRPWRWLTLLIEANVLTTTPGHHHGYRSSLCCQAGSRAVLPTNPWMHLTWHLMAFQTWYISVGDLTKVDRLYPKFSAVDRNIRCTGQLFLVPIIVGLTQRNLWVGMASPTVPSCDHIHSSVTCYLYIMHL